ncbi:hypothetical protein CWATWH0402_3517 [Crocosphaera watsonii WH 0402]|nr:hypothetical protein CWATWH0402_3517 [Crocosphaera watsonii WH 0402]
MAAFRGKNKQIILVRNHELTPDANYGINTLPEYKYNPISQGGTITLIINENGTLDQEFVSLAGTNRNCSGGTTPWNSWISCEEDTAIYKLKNRNSGEEIIKKHGYNFEVPSQGKITKPTPLLSMGRFRHEAIAVDPKTG